MGKAVLELQLEIINNSSDIISILRKAHLIAAKLSLKDFDLWIQNELNGYQKYDDIPEYRTVVGEIKAKNPYYGLIPVMMPKDMAYQLSKRKLPNSISDIVDLQKKNEFITITLPMEISEILCANEGIVFSCYFVFGAHCLSSIIEKVKNTILEWCIKLEKDGIVGDDYIFSDKEKELARQLPQQINNYYGQIVNGNVNNSQLVTGDNNVTTLKTGLSLNDVDDIKEKLKKEKISSNQRKEAIEILDDVKEAVNKKKSNIIIKSMLNGLKDFLLSVGANITASLITAKIQGLY